MVNIRLIHILLFSILLLFSSKFGRAVDKDDEKGKHHPKKMPVENKHESPSNDNNPLHVNLNLSLALPSPVDFTNPDGHNHPDLELRMGLLSTNSPKSSSSKNKMPIVSSSLQFPLHNDPMELTMTNTHQGISSSHFTEQIQPSEMPLPREQYVQSNIHHQNVPKSNISQQTPAEKQIGPFHSQKQIILQSPGSAFNVYVRGKNQVGASLPSEQHQSSTSLNVQPERPNLSERHQENLGQQTRPSSLQLFPSQDRMEMTMTNIHRQSDPSSQQNEHDKRKQIQPSEIPPPREHVDPIKVQHEHGTNPSTNTPNYMGFIYSDFFPPNSEHSGTNLRSKGEGIGSSSSHATIDNNLRPPLSNPSHLQRNFSKKSLQRQFSKISHDLVTSKKTGQNPIQSSQISSPPEYHPPKYSRSHSDINPRKSVYSEDLKGIHTEISGFLDDLKKKLENKNEDEENIKYRKFVEDSFHQQISGQQVGPSQLQSPTSGSASNKNKRKNNEDGQQQQEIVHILDSDDEQEGQDDGHGGHLKHGQNKRDGKGKDKDVEGSGTKDGKKGY